ncbi:hypothetical protein [Streptomyces sp. NBC_01240]|uniref:hypothetical protein n=1 Tax=Streptomyces sp. NBC_01240 TaxID=2903793 RepID=UPI002E0D42E0|nr:hypothetical protein OG466_40850 [Streptomyces sp. NBC_01240]
MLTGPIPTDLCPAHNEIARGWRDNHYNWRDPSEWPAGVSAPYRTHILDNRTSHEEREKRFDEKNQQQIDLVVQSCRSGRSPQCGATPANEETAR